jgi:hypothetical protein
MKILFSLRPYRFIRIGLGLVFFIIVLSKLFDPKTLAKALSVYNIVPEQFLPFVSIDPSLKDVFAGFILISNMKGSERLVVFYCGINAAEAIILLCGHQVRIKEHIPLSW